MKLINKRGGNMFNAIQSIKSYIYRVPECVGAVWNTSVAGSEPQITGCITPTNHFGTPTAY